MKQLIVIGLLCLGSLLSASDSLVGWKSMGRGKHGVTYDDVENALVFTSDTGAGVRAASYPIRSISAALKGHARFFCFELMLPEQPSPPVKGEIVLPKQEKHSGKIAFPLPERGKWASIKVDLASDGYDFSRAGNLQIFLESSGNSLRALVRNIRFEDGQGRPVGQPAEKKPKITISPIGVRQFYLRPGRKSTLRFQAEGASPDVLRSSLLDYRGRAAGNVELHKQPDSGLYIAELALPAGFYELKIPAAETRFGIVVLELFSGDADPFFGIEPLLIHRRLSDSLVGENLDVLKQYGVNSLREYHSWQNEKREPAAAPWKKSFFDQVAARRMKSCFFFGFAPDWTGIGGNHPGEPGYQPYPKDLIAMGKMIAATVSDWSGGVNCFQIWNEPDLKPIPPDQYLSLVAAASAAMTGHGIDLPLAGAGFANSRPPTDSYLNTEMIDFIDIFAFHTYLGPEDMVSRIGYFRDRMIGSKRGIPIWITETGKAWDRGIVARQVYGGPPGLPRACPEDDRISALWITMKGIEAKAAGVAGYFPFAMKFFPEGNANFGMTDFFWTPQRSIAAYLNSVRELAGRQYIGDAVPLPEGVRGLRIFSGRGTCIGVIHTGHPDAVTVDLNHLPVLAVRSMDGSPLASSGGKVEIYGGIGYIELDSGKLAGILDPNTDAMKYFRIARAYRPVPRKSSPVVYQFHHWDIAEKDGYSYLAAPGILNFTVFNLSDQPQTAVPELSLPPGVGVLSSPEKINLPPNSSRKLAWRLDWRNNRAPRSRIILYDRFNHSLPLPLNFLDFKPTRAEEMELNDFRRWQPNTSGNMKISFDAEEKAIHFQILFDSADPKRAYWAYPEYILRKPGESLDGAVAVSFEIRAEQGDRIERYAGHNLMITYDGDDRYCITKIPQPSPVWRSVRVPLPPDWNTARINRLRIGLNAVSDRLDFRLRNLKILYGISDRPSRSIIPPDASE